MAAGAFAQMTFDTSVRVQVGRIMSSVPSVLSVDSVVIDPDQQRTTFDVHAGAPGLTKLFALRPGDTVIDEHSVFVDTVATVDASVPAQVVAGGRAMITGDKRSSTGAALFGRGGYEVTAPDGVRIVPAAPGDAACGIFTTPADFVVQVDVPGTYPLAIAPGAATASLEVVPRSAVVGVTFWGTSELYGNSDGTFSAGVLPIPTDASGEPVDGADCTWSTSRPVELQQLGCMRRVVTRTNQPVDLICSFDDRVLGTLHITAAPPPSN